MTESADQQRSPESPRRGGFTPRRARFWLVAFAPLVLWLVATALPVLPGPPQLGLVAGLAAGYGVIGFLLVGIGYPVALLSTAVSAAIAGPERRRGLLWVALSLLLGIALFLPSLGVASIVRMRLIRQATFRAEPLLHALERYREDHGAYPDALEELQPGYVAEVPGTGMIAHPDFVYVPPGEAKPEADGYGLVVHCFLIGGFDSLHYWPSQTYPEKMYGGVVERIDGWAYVHE